MRRVVRSHFLAARTAVELRGGQNNVFNRLATLGKTDKRSGEERRPARPAAWQWPTGWLAPLQLWHSRAVAVVPPLVVGSWNAAAAAAVRCELRKERLHRRRRRHARCTCSWLSRSETASFSLSLSS